MSRGTASSSVALPASSLQAPLLYFFPSPGIAKCFCSSELCTCSSGQEHSPGCPQGLTSHHHSHVALTLFFPKGLPSGSPREGFQNWTLEAGGNDSVPGHTASRERKWGESRHVRDKEARKHFKKLLHKYWACVQQPLKATCLEPAPQQEKPKRWRRVLQWRVTPAYGNWRKSVGSNKGPEGSRQK